MHLLDWLDNGPLTGAFTGSYFWDEKKYEDEVASGVYIIRRTR
jgi:hypothetical protein